MRMIGIALGIAIVTFFTLESFDFDAKPPAKPQPVTPTYTQYMSCQQGEDYSDLAFGNMISGFNSLDIKGLVMSAGHTIVDGDSVGGNDFRWQLFWKDKKSAESFWDKGPSDEFSAWADASRSVMVCDGVGRRDYTFELPGVQPDWGGASEFVSIFRACKYTENGGKSSLSSMYSKFNDFVAKENKDASWHVFSTRAKRGPFDYAVYFHDGENSEAFMEYDFFWVNYLADLDEAAERGAQWVETGGDLQAEFDEIAECNDPATFTSQVLYSMIKPEDT